MALLAVLIGAAGAVDLWSLYWWHPIGIVARLTFAAVVVALFVAVHMLTLSASHPGRGDDGRS